MKQLIGSGAGGYIFNPAARTITITGITGLQLGQFLLVTNVTRGAVIYNFADPSLGGNYSNGVLTLNAPCTDMQASDQLQIFVDLPVPQALDPATDSSVKALLAQLVSQQQSQTDALLQLARKVPQLLTQVGNKLLVQADTSTTILTQPSLTISSSGYALGFEGQHYTNLRWQQQRTMMNVQ